MSFSFELFSPIFSLDIFLLSTTGWTTGQKLKGSHTSWIRETAVTGGWYLILLRIPGLGVIKIQRNISL